MQPYGPVSADGFWTWNGSEWVPNPQRPVGAGSSATPYESADFRATMATLFLAANAVGVSLFVAFDGVELIGLQQSTPSDSFEFALANFALLSLIAVYGTYVPAIVFFCMWLHRVVRNMPALGSPDPRWTPRGAVIRCFIPFLNLVHPLFSVLDVWRGARPDRRWSDLASRMALSIPLLIVGWWGAWLLARVVGWVASRMTRSSDLSVQFTGFVVDMGGNLLLITSAVLAIFVVRSVTARQEIKNHLIVTGQLA